MNQDNAYIQIGGEPGSAQLELFETNEDTNKGLDIDIGAVIAEINSRRKWSCLNKARTFQHVIGSFNIYPTTTRESHLKRARYPSSATDALSKDWNNVGLDIVLALLEEHQKLRKQHG